MLACLQWYGFQIIFGRLCIKGYSVDKVVVLSVSNNHDHLDGYAWRPGLGVKLLVPTIAR
ncbi:hypothetical protein Hdeb2414_s0005g00160341 [Helianthus debilis subsp. tardiflorus]